jgi:hypothetical protein
MRDVPGVFNWVDKHELIVDPDYQRLLVEEKALEFSRNWSWQACGALTVGNRDGKLHVIDGQHRHNGAMRRSDIKSLPCLIFQTTTQREEAESFLQTNTNRKPISSIDRHRASLMTEDEASVLVERMVREAGRHVSAKSSANTVSCVTALTYCLRVDRQVMERLWPIMAEISVGEPLDNILVRGLWYLEKGLIEGQTLIETIYVQRMKKLRSVGLVEGARKLAHYEGKGGSKVWARGMRDALNKGLRNRDNILVMRHDTAEG